MGPPNGVLKGDAVDVKRSLRTSRSGVAIVLMAVSGRNRVWNRARYKIMVVRCSADGIRIS